MSIHRNKKTTDLAGFKLELDTSELSSDDLFLFRPIILFEDLSEVRFFADEYQLDTSRKNIIFNFSKNPIRLENNKTYFLGIEIINKKESNKQIKTRALNKKGAYSMQKTHLNYKWFKQENVPYGYTLDYELFLVALLKKYR